VKRHSYVTITIANSLKWGGEERGKSESGPYVGAFLPRHSRGILVDPPMVRTAEGFGSSN